MQKVTNFIRSKKDFDQVNNQYKMEKYNYTEDFEDVEKQFTKVTQDINETVDFDGMDDGEEQINSNSKSSAAISGDEFDSLDGPLGKNMDIFNRDEESLVFQNQADMNTNKTVIMNIDIPSFQERKDGVSTVVFYNVVVGFQKNKKTWTLQKRYSEFDTLDKFLRERYPNIPSLPKKTLFKISEQKAIEERQNVLTEYLKALINRKDMRSCLQFRKFLDFEMNFPQSAAFEAKKIGVMQDFQKGVRDFIYMPQYNTALVMCSEMNLATRMDSYFTNFNLPWEKKGKSDKNTKNSALTNEAVATVGTLTHYKIVMKSDEQNKSLFGGVEQRWEYRPTWAKTFPSQTNIMHWCEEQSILYVGLDSGIIHRFYCPVEKNLAVMKELEPITVQGKMQRIMGITVDPTSNHMFSISESGYLIVTDLAEKCKENGCQLISSQQLCQKSGLKAMAHDFQRNLLFIASGSGDIYIMNSKASEPELITSVQTDQKVCIRGLSRSFNTMEYWSSKNHKEIKSDSSSNYLMASDVDGYITIFDIGNPGKEKVSKRIGNAYGNKKMRVILWKDKGREIISGDEEGYVTFWNSKDGQPLYVMKAHQGPITQMRWNEDEQQLITGSKDKTIKLWQIPNEWVSEIERKGGSTRQQAVKQLAPGKDGEEELQQIGSSNGHLEEQQHDVDSDDDLVGWEK